MGFCSRGVKGWPHALQVFVSMTVSVKKTVWKRSQSRRIATDRTASRAPIFLYCRNNGAWTVSCVRSASCIHCASDALASVLDLQFRGPCACVGFRVFRPACSIRYNTARSSASDDVRAGSLLLDYVQLSSTEQRRPQCCSQHGHNIRQGLLGQFVLLEKRMPQGLSSRVPGKLIGQTDW